MSSGLRIESWESSSSPCRPLPAPPAGDSYCRSLPAPPAGDAGRAGAAAGAGTSRTAREAALSSGVVAGEGILLLTARVVEAAEGAGPSPGGTGSGLRLDLVIAFQNTKQVKIGFKLYTVVCTVLCTTLFLYFGLSCDPFCDI